MVDVSWHVNCLSAAQIRLFTTVWMSKLRQMENCMEQLVFLAAVEEELAALRQRKIRFEQALAGGDQFL
jgi:hypothetical protein